jgi:hypothetical protein
MNIPRQNPPAAQHISKFITAVALLLPMQAFSFGSSELTLCTDIGAALDKETYTNKAREYLTEKTGVVPAWLVAKAANKALGKIKYVNPTSAAAKELNEWCSIAQEPDEVQRSGKAIAKIISKTGPIGTYVAAQVGAGLVVLQEGTKLISKTNTLLQASGSEVVFNVEIMVPRWWWTDRVMDLSSTQKEISSIQVIANVDGVNVASVSRPLVGGNCNIADLACFSASFDFPDYAAAAYLIRVDLVNEQRIYLPVSYLKAFSGRSARTLRLKSSLTENGASLYVPE